MLHGSPQVLEYFCEALLHVTEDDHSFIPLDSTALDLFNSLIPFIPKDNIHLFVFLFGDCVTYFVKGMELQHLINSHLLENYLLLKGHNSTLSTLMRFVHTQTSIAVNYKAFLGYLVDIGLLEFFISALTEDKWNIDDHQVSEIEDEVKVVTALVMKFDPLYLERVLQMDLPAHLREVLMIKCEAT
jgi:hypothetical protein